MPRVLTDEGLTDIRDAIKARITHLGVATDQTAWAANQTDIDPANAGAANYHIEAATKTDVAFNAFDAVITITGSTEFTGKNIYTIAPMDGAARGDAVGRYVRSLPVGVIAGDSFSIGLRFTVSDVS